jgi:hypothetical protein
MLNNVTRSDFALTLAHSLHFKMLSSVAVLNGISRRESKVVQILCESPAKVTGRDE